MIEAKGESTTVEIILYYLTFSIFLFLVRIYNSRNYSILLNKNKESGNIVSTTVEIILYYLTRHDFMHDQQSTTVEIILYYLTLIC